MLSENIKVRRKAQGLSQEALAIKLNVVRQTISKWEQGLSVPDADMLISLSEILETPVSVLLGETVTEAPADDVKALSEKLEAINLQFARRTAARRRILHVACLGASVLVVVGFLALLFLGSPYRALDFSDPEMAVIGTGLRAFEWLFVRTAPFALIGSSIGAILTRRRA